MRIDQNLREIPTSWFGSFWERSPNLPQLKAIASVGAGAEAMRSIEGEAARLTVEGRRWVTDVNLPFLDGNVSILGRDLLRPPEPILNGGPAVLEATEGFGTMGGEADAFPFNMESTSSSVWAPTYFIPIPADITPVVISTEGRELVSGIDFYCYAGFIAMIHPPAELFTKGQIHVRCGWRKNLPPYPYTFGADGSDYGQKWIASYARESRSASFFVRAAAEASGHWVLPFNDTVVMRHELAFGVRYTMARSGVVDVHYSHRVLRIGETYPKGYIVSVNFCNMRGEAGWASRWTYGSLELDGVIPFDGLSVSNGSSVRVRSVAVNPENAKIHANFHFEGDPAVLSRFDEWQRLHELHTGMYLSDALGVTTAAPTGLVNFGSFLETYYGESLILLDCRHMDMSQLARLRKWAAENKPSTSVLLLLTGRNTEAHWQVDEVTGKPITTSWNAAFIDVTGRLSFALEDSPAHYRGFFLLTPDRAVLGDRNANDFDAYSRHLVTPGGQFLAGPDGYVYVT